MNVIIDGDSALCEVPFEANQYHDAGVRVDKWKRTPVNPQKPGFEIKVYVEGYRLDKDVWLHDTYSFGTFLEILEFYEKLSFAIELEDLLDFNRYEGSGWYGFSYEYCKIYEYNADGSKFEWERER